MFQNFNIFISFYFYKISINVLKHYWHDDKHCRPWSDCSYEQSGLGLNCLLDILFQSIQDNNGRTTYKPDIGTGMVFSA